MQKTLLNSQDILGHELCSVFQETFGDEPAILEEILAEAVRALRTIEESQDFEGEIFEYEEVKMY